jgi:hypothetical protein
MWRRHFHQHPDLRFEGCRLPGKLGIRERLGAQPHRQGELRGDGTDEGLHLWARDVPPITQGLPADTAPSSRGILAL